MIELSKDIVRQKTTSSERRSTAGGSPVRDSWINPKSVPRKRMNLAIEADLLVLVQSAVAESFSLMPYSS